MSREHRAGGAWYLVLMIWGGRYGDEHCNRIIAAVFEHSRNCSGAVVLTDRMDRRIDERARKVPISEYFDTPRMKSRGLPVKISMFDIPEVPAGATCIYLDLDTVVIGNLDRLAALAREAPIWTIPVFPRPFSRLYRTLWRLSRRAIYTIGNSSAFVYRNGFKGNPTQIFRDLSERDRLPEDLYHDDRFIAWACQDKIRGLPINDVVNFRFEFLAPTLWLSDLFSLLRRRGRQKIAAITFAGPETKPETLLGLPYGSVVKDHHGRVGRWNDFHTSGLRDKMIRSYTKPSSQANAQGGPP